MFLSAARSGDADSVIQCVAGGNVDVNVNNAVSWLLLDKLCRCCVNFRSPCREGMLFSGILFS